MYDLVIRGGSIYDGTGGPARSGDVAIKDGLIAAIGKVGSTEGRQTIEADGAIVTPGFVDLHSHYDGQFLWDDKIDPSFSHGITTSIAGNCGVGVAPVSDEYQSKLIDFMTGVEEIPEIVLEVGLDWSWRSFPEYLDKLAERKYTMDVGVHLPHAPVRLLVMGERALKHEAATADDIIAMSAIVRDAMAAGAQGFSTGRVVEHRSSDGNYLPGTFALEDEVLALAKALGEGGRGVFQVAPRGELGNTFNTDGSDGREARTKEHRLMEKIATVSGRPLNYGVLEVFTDEADAGIMIGQSDQAIARGVGVYPMVSPRAANLMYTLEGYHLFMARPSYLEVARMPLAERVHALRDPVRKRAILSESDVTSPVGVRDHGVLLKYISANNEQSFILSSPMDIEPGPERRLGALAAAAGKSADEYLYDHLTAGDGTNVNLNIVANYFHGNLESTRKFMMNPNTIIGLGDGGAHLKLICDAAHTTCQIAYWTRDRSRGERIPLEFMVEKLAAAPARHHGLTDRGVLAVGKRADINVIDYERLTLKRSRIVHDLPTGAGRCLQPSQGYLATVVAGVPTRLNDEDTLARPGRLLRSTAFTPELVR